MKITKNQLKQIIKEELGAVLRQESGFRGSRTQRDANIASLGGRKNELMDAYEESHGIEPRTPEYQAFVDHMQEFADEYEHQGDLRSYEKKVIAAIESFSLTK